jgi:Bacterial PH domain
VDSVTLRPRFGQVLTVIVGLICSAALVTYVVIGDFAGLARYAWPLLLVAFLSWMLFWSPSLTVDPGGVVIRNLLREHRVSWPAILRIDTKYALTLYTNRGKYTAWSAPAPSILATTRATRSDLKSLPESTYGAGGGIRPGDLPTSDSGLAGFLVRQKYEALRDAGHLDKAVVEGRGVTTRWLLPNAIVLAILVASSVVSLFV